MQCRSGFSVAIDVSVFIVDTVSVIVVVALIVVITTADVVVVVVTVEGGEVADALLSRTKYLETFLSCFTLWVHILSRSTSLFLLTLSIT